MSNLLLQRLEKLVLLTDEDRQALLSRSHRIHRFGPREDLIQDGQDPQYVNLILDGWAYRYKNLKDGRRQIISFFVPGDMCDPMSFLFREVTHSLGSLTPVTVARLTGEEMESLTAESPALAKAFWLEMLVSAEIQREWTVSLGCRSATERMAHLFCEMTLRLATVGLSDGRECEVPVTQADLADALGLSTVHINRTLQELRGAGLIEFKGRKLTIRNEQALQDLAMFDPSYLHLGNMSPP